MTLILSREPIGILETFDYLKERAAALIASLPADRQIVVLTDLQVALADDPAPTWATAVLSIWISELEHEQEI